MWGMEAASSRYLILLFLMVIRSLEVTAVKLARQATTVVVVAAVLFRDLNTSKMRHN